MTLGGRTLMTYKVCTPYMIHQFMINHLNTPPHMQTSVKFTSKNNQLEYECRLSFQACHLITCFDQTFSSDTKLNWIGNCQL